MILAVKLKLRTTPENLEALHTVVEVLYGEEKPSIEWAILTLVFQYEYGSNIEEAEILYTWNEQGDELQSRIIAESDGLRNEQARSDNGVLFEYYDNKKPYPKSF